MIDRGGKRVYDFTTTREEQPPQQNEARQREQLIIDAAVEVVPEQVPAQHLAATRDLIMRAMETLDLQVAAIRHDLGEPSHPENARWLAKATAAQRIKVKLRVRLQNKLGEIHRLIRVQNRLRTEEQQKSKNARFILLVKEHISKELYLKIWQQVNEEFEGDDPNEERDTSEK